MDFSSFFENYFSELIQQQYQWTYEKKVEKIKSLMIFYFSFRDNMFDFVSYSLNPKHTHEWGLHSFFLKYVEKDWSILDIGCGFGELTIKLAKKVKNIDAYAFNSDAIKVAKEKNNAKNINYFVGDALQNMPDKKYDCVILSGILSSLSEEERNIFLIKLHFITNILLVRDTRWDNDLFALLAKEFGIQKSKYFEFRESDLKSLLNKNNWGITEYESTYDLFLKLESKIVSR